MFNKYILNSITYLESENTSWLTNFVEQNSKDFWISLYIVNDNEKLDTCKNITWSSIILTDIEIASKLFPFESILSQQMINMNKLLIIQKLTWDLLKTEYMNSIFVNNKELNFTIIVLSFEEGEKHLLNYVDNIMFGKSHKIKELYQKCFLVYPMYDVYKKFMLDLPSDSELLYLKKSKRYISCNNRFILFKEKNELDRAHNTDDDNDNNANYNDDNNEFNSEEVMTITI